MQMYGTQDINHLLLMDIYHLFQIVVVHENQNMKKRFIIEIFEPSVPPLPDSDNEIEYCSAIEILPV